MVLGPFRSPNQISQGVSSPQHARLNTVAHLGTERVGSCGLQGVSVASTGSPIKDATLAQGALEQGCKATSQLSWQSLSARLLGDRWGPSSLGVPPTSLQMSSKGCDLVKSHSLFKGVLKIRMCKI